MKAVRSSDPVDQLRLIRTEGVGPVTYRRLLQRFASAAAALDALPRMARAGGRSGPLKIPSRSEAEREIDRLARLNARLLFLGDPTYPPLLAMLDDAPPCLAVAGDVSLLSAPAVAMVGGRNASANGQNVAETLAAELARLLVVVSGMARGIDAAAHRGALRSGRTVAAVAGGLDVPYPEDHAELQRRIAENGAVVSESPLGTVPQSRHFPRRNRIIAGLSLGVLVVEAAPHSGSLITARIAQDAGREVFAVPGSPLDPRARGGNDLIRQGAILTETAEDVMQHLPRPDALSHALSDTMPGWTAGPTVAGVREAETEASVLSEPVQIMTIARAEVLGLLGPSPLVVDDLVRRCQLSPSAVIAALLELELAGRVETLPGGRVALLSGVAH